MAVAGIDYRHAARDSPAAVPAPEVVDVAAVADRFGPAVRRARPQGRDEIALHGRDIICAFDQDVADQVNAAFQRAYYRQQPVKERSEEGLGGQTCVPTDRYRLSPSA